MPHQKYDLATFCKLVSNPDTSVYEVQDFLNLCEEKLNFDACHPKTNLRPVEYAALKGNAFVLAHLIEFLGADINANDKPKNLIEYALENPDENVTRYLLSFSHITTRLNDGTTQLHIDILSNNEEKVFTTLRQCPEEFLKKNSTDLCALWWATDEGLLERLKNFGKELSLHYFNNQQYELLADVFTSFAFYHFHHYETATTLVYLEKSLQYYHTALESNKSDELLNKIKTAVSTFLSALTDIDSKQPINDDDKIFSTQTAIDFLKKQLILLDKHDDTYQLTTYTELKDKILKYLYDAGISLFSYIEKWLDKSNKPAFSILRKQQCYEQLNSILELCQKQSSVELRTQHCNELKDKLHNLSNYFSELYKSHEIDLFDENIFAWHEKQLTTLNHLKEESQSILAENNKRKTEILSPKNEESNASKKVKNESSTEEQSRYSFWQQPDQEMEYADVAKKTAATYVKNILM